MLFPIFCAMTISSPVIAKSFEGILCKVDLPSRSGAPYALMLSRPVPDFDADFLFLNTTDDLSPFSQKQVVVKGQIVGVDDTCHYMVPLIDLESVQSVELDEDFEDAPEWSIYISSVAKAGVAYACWRSWAQGDYVVRGKNGGVIAIYPDGKEVAIQKLP